MRIIKGEQWSSFIFTNKLCQKRWIFGTSVIIVIFSWLLAPCCNLIQKNNLCMQMCVITFKCSIICFRWLFCWTYWLFRTLYSSSLYKAFYPSCYLNYLTADMLCSCLSFSVCLFLFLFAFVFEEFRGDR